MLVLCVISCGIDDPERPLPPATEEPVGDNNGGETDGSDSGTDTGNNDSASSCDDNTDPGNGDSEKITILAQPSAIDFGEEVSDAAIQLSAIGRGSAQWHIACENSAISFSPAGGSIAADNEQIVIAHLDRNILTEPLTTTAYISYNNDLIPIEISASLAPADTYALPEGTTAYYAALDITAKGCDICPPMIDSAAWTVSFFITASTDGNVFYVERNDGAAMQSLSLDGGRLCYAMSADNNRYNYPSAWMYLCSTKITDSKRRHVVLTSRHGVYSANDVVTTLYINGVEQGSAIESHNEVADPHIGRGKALHIGDPRIVNLLTTLGAAHITLTDIRIYASKALTATEAYALYMVEK